MKSGAYFLGERGLYSCIICLQELACWPLDFLSLPHKEGFKSARSVSEPHPGHQCACSAPELPACFKAQKGTRRGARCAPLLLCGVGGVSPIPGSPDAPSKKRDDPRQATALVGEGPGGPPARTEQELGSLRRGSHLALACCRVSGKGAGKKPRNTCGGLTFDRPNVLGGPTRL